MDLVSPMATVRGYGSEPLPDLGALRRVLARSVTAQAVAEQVIARRRAVTADGIWISEVPEATLRERAAALDALPRAARGALHGVPFAVKDNLDLAGLPTTAACPDFAYVPAHTAPAVQRLLDAGAILVGKTNMDQFATGLSGTRTPVGAPANAFDAEYICGGSSSGSALALAHGLVSFALGTDTAGSGRVPAALGNVIGLKPSRGLVSSRGVLPACRSLDCVSVFALTCADAAAVLDVIAGFDAKDPFARAGWPAVPALGAAFRFGVPQSDQLDFDGDAAGAAAFARTVAAFEALGGTAVPVDYTPFRETARLLYDGPWLTERRLAVGDFLDRRPDAVLPVVRDIILGAEITPELIPTEDGEKPQATEDTVGPYALADFALYHVLRRGHRPSKIAFLAWHAWHDAEAGDWPTGISDVRRVAYDLPTIRQWLEVFLRRFFASQFKRSALPNGPKVSAGGTMSPRGDWRMPSDASPAAWLAELERVPVD